MSFYAPSFMSQLLVPAGVIAGIAATLYAAPKLDVAGATSVVAALAVGLVGGAIALFAHGYQLRFDEPSRLLVVRERLFGITQRERSYSYDDIRSLKLKQDGDGFPLITLELADGGKYAFCRRNTRDQFERLCSVVGREYER